MAALAIRDKGLERYIREVTQYPVLSPEKERELAKKFIKTGKIEAAHQLVVSNLRFVVKLAYEYKGYGFKLLDLIQEGNIGLMKAVKKFDLEKGYRLISYASYWIRYQIHSFIMGSWSLVKLGSGHAKRKLFNKLRSERSKAETRANGKVSKEEMAKKLGVSIASYDEMEMRLALEIFH